MKRAMWLVSVVLCVTLPFVTGCWDRLEIEDRGTILGLAIDPVGDKVDTIAGPDANSDARGYKVTAQVAIPGRIPLGPGGGGASPGSTEKPVWVVSSTGRTMADAMNVLQQELADRVFLGHLRVIIINDDLANSTGIGDIQDYFRRNSEVRRLAWLIISHDSAASAMEAAPKLERVPTLYLVGTMDHAVEMGKLPNTFLGNYWSVLSARGMEPVLPFISIRGEDRVRIDGLAVFKGDKMVGSLDPLETASFMEIMNQRRAGYLVAVPKPGDPKRSVLIKGTNRREKIKMHKETHGVSFNLYSRIEANISEKTGPKPIDEQLPQIERAVAKKLTEGQTRLIQKTQKLGVDIFGFGERVRGGYPTYWLDDVQTREKWDEVYRHVPISCHVKMYMRRFGMAAH